MIDDSVLTTHHQPLLNTKNKIKQVTLTPKHNYPSSLELVAHLAGIDDYSYDPFQPPVMKSVVLPVFNSKASGIQHNN